MTHAQPASPLCSTAPASKSDQVLGVAARKACSPPRQSRRAWCCSLTTPCAGYQSRRARHRAWLRTLHDRIASSVARSSVHRQPSFRSSPATPNRSSCRAWAVLRHLRSTCARALLPRTRTLGSAGSNRTTRPAIPSLATASSRCRWRRSCSHAWHGSASWRHWRRRGQVRRPRRMPTHHRSRSSTRSPRPRGTSCAARTGTPPRRPGRFLATRCRRCSTRCGTARRSACKTHGATSSQPSCTRVR